MIAKFLKIPILICILVLTTLVYVRVIFMDYVSWDDNVLILENPFLKLPFLELIRQSFTQFYHGDYFPLTLFSFWLDYQLVGFNPFFQHGENLLLHLGNVFLLYHVLKRLFDQPEDSKLILLILGLFALHPMQVESVAWLSERKGLWASFCALNALYFCATPVPKERKFHWFLYWVFFGISLLFKTSALFLPLLGVWMDGLLHKRGRGVLFFKHSPPLLMSLILGWVRTQAYGSSISNFQEVIGGTQHWLELPMKMVAGLGFYITKWIWPHDLSIIYSPYRSVMNALPWLSAGILYVLCLGLIWLFHYRKSQGQEVPFRRWIFFIFWTLFLLLPVLQFIPRINFVNDRYIYLVNIGISATLLIPCRSILGSIPILKLANFWDGYSWKFLRIFSGVFLGMTLGLLTSSALKKWSNSKALWEQTVEQRPWSGIAHNNLGMVYQQEGNLEAAIQSYQKSIENGQLDGTSLLGINSLGAILINSRLPAGYSLERGIELLKRGVAMGGKSEQTFYLRFNLALGYLENQRTSEAGAVLKDLRDLLDKSSNQHFHELRVRVIELQNNLPGSL